MNDGGEKEHVFKHPTGIIMTQMLAKTGIKKHGKLAWDVLFNEFL